MRAIYLLLFLVAGASNGYALDFSHYHSQDEINAYMHDLSRTYPQLVHFHALGYSEQGREINYVVISKGDADALPAIYMNGTHHGNEKSSTEAILGLMNYLVEHRADGEIASLLENYAIYLQPLVNPDGHAANTRTDSRGIDPNRDYAFPERGDEESFKTSSTKHIRELAEKVKFRAAAAFHSGMEAVLWAGCYSAKRPTENDIFYTLSKLSGDAMGIHQYSQSYQDYPTRGEFIDYLYMTQGTLAVTFEVSEAGTPAPTQLAKVVQRSTVGSIVFMLGVMQLDEGTLEIRKAPETAERAAGRLAAATSKHALVATKATSFRTE